MYVEQGHIEEEKGAIFKNAEAIVLRTIHPKKEL